MDITGTINTEDPNDTNKEVKKIYGKLFGSALFNKVEVVLEDITKLFNGSYPPYAKCDTGYHDLEHTLHAYLAMARIISGLIREHPTAISKEFVVLGLISALGHDTGYIRERDDIEGTGGKYTQIHMNRSREFMGKYLHKLKYNLRQIQYIQNIISCTGLQINMPSIPFTSKIERKTGYILGTADLIGQMSAPNYLEKLPKLYDEFNDGGVPGYSSAKDLIEKTPVFWEDVVMKRLKKDFHSVYRFAANYFEGSNYYIIGVNRNIAQISQRLSRNSSSSSSRGHNIDNSDSISSILH